MEDITKELWAVIKELNLEAGNQVPLEKVAEKFLKETEYHPDDVVEAFEEMAKMGWLEEKGRGAVLTKAGFKADVETSD